MINMKIIDREMKKKIKKHGGIFVEMQCCLKQKRFTIAKDLMHFLKLNIKNPNNMTYSINFHINLDRVSQAIERSKN